MDVAVAAFAFAPGLALGSFLNVVAARVPLRRSVVKPASACMSCGTEIAARGNRTIYHSNAITTWAVSATGEVKHVYA